MTTAGGTSTTSANDQFAYVGAPTVTAVSPTSGPTAGGTSVTITGTNLGSATTATVTFGATAATIVSDNGTTLVATSPAGGVGTVNITVTTAGGTSTTSASDQFIYVAAPTVTTVSPPSGPTVGGTTVTITGTNLGTPGSAAIAFGATAATIVSDSGTTLVAISPAGAAGTVNITVTTAGGISTTWANDEFTYVAAPTVTTVSPASGPTAGGNTLTITGSNLGTAATALVTFGATAATIVSDNGTTLVAINPTGVAGTVNITVTTAGGTSTTSANDQFIYMALPTVTTVSPMAGPTAGGSTVTITGTSLGTAATALVTFGATAATIVSDDGTTLVATSPTGVAGTVNITVTTAGGTSVTSANDEFTYWAAPTLTSVSPATGPTAGNTTVTITGTNLGTASTATVYFDSTAATIVSDSGTTLVVTSPAESAGTVDVTVATAGGTSVISATDEFSFAGVPSVTNISPTSGTTAGGTSVTITGSNLGTVSTATVDFGSTSATIVSDDGATLIVTSPEEDAGPVDVTVTTAGGTSAASIFTYIILPNVTSVSPATGPTAGGSTVTITGTNLGTPSTATVDFGSISATIVSDDGTTLIVTNPGEIPGTVDVTVTTDLGTSAISAADEFIYAGLPTITNISPTSGSTAGGTLVTITGTNLGTASTATVDFGSTAAIIVSDDGTNLVVTNPAEDAGPVDVTVTTAGGTSAADNFTYNTQPNVTSVTPISGPTAGGTSVTITGTSLGTTSTATVNFGSTPATIVSDNGTTLVVTSPGGVAGTVDVTVTTDLGTSAISAADEFTYAGVPNITDISPVSGPTAGGSTVTITGTNLGTTSTATVDFGKRWRLLSATTARHLWPPTLPTPQERSTSP